MMPLLHRLQNITQELELVKNALSLIADEDPRRFRRVLNTIPNISLGIITKEPIGYDKHTGILHFMTPINITRHDSNRAKLELARLVIGYSTYGYIAQRTFRIRHTKGNSKRLGQVMEMEKARFTKHLGQPWNSLLD